MTLDAVEANGSPCCARYRKDTDSAREIWRRIELRESSGDVLLNDTAASVSG